jgi:hypothetical protein
LPALLLPPPSPRGADLAAAAEAGGCQAGARHLPLQDRLLRADALYDGIWYRPITDKFIRNAPFAEVERALSRRVHAR